MVGVGGRHKLVGIDRACRQMWKLILNSSRVSMNTVLRIPALKDDD